jgi:hypothetical protein
MITVTKQVFFTRSARGRRRIKYEPSPSQIVPPGRVPRVSRVMALAIQFEQLLRDGTVSNTIELASLARVTQSRITQVMNLLHLAPDIQEELLFLPLVMRGDDPIHEKLLRPVCAATSFAKQRCLWVELKSRRRIMKPAARDSIACCARPIERAGARST